MYSQFFGSYLLRREAITPEQLTHAISSMSKSHIKLGTLAIHNGYMTASEVDEVCLVQTRQDKRFGEIAVEQGFLTDEQVHEMLSAQIPNFLLLGQCLVEDGAITNSDLETYILDYESENEMSDIDLDEERSDKIRQLIQRYFTMAEIPVSDYSIMYLELLFNNLTRFIGEDFTPLTPIPCTEFPINYCVTQELHGKVNCVSRINMTEDVAVQFASRFVDEEFTAFDEYVQASLEDFLNLHNGLFSVNMSNEKSVELTLEPPIANEGEVLTLAPSSFVLPVNYPFGVLQLIVSLDGEE
jgi:CheY-specific phosphatase CheX